MDMKMDLRYAVVAGVGVFIMLVGIRSPFVKVVDGAVQSNDWKVILLTFGTVLTSVTLTLALVDGMWIERSNTQR